MFINYFSLLLSNMFMNISRNGVLSPRLLWKFLQRNQCIRQRSWRLSEWEFRLLHLNLFRYYWILHCIPKLRGDINHNLQQMYPERPPFSLSPVLFLCWFAGGCLHSLAMCNTSFEPSQHARRGKSDSFRGIRFLRVD